MTALAPAALRLSARAVSARIALRHLAAAKAASKRLRETDDAEALHDARVALRRLRSTLRAYAPYMKQAATGKIRRRLRALSRASTAARDAEVQLAWLGALKPGSAPEQAARAWLRDRLGARRDAAQRTIRSEFRPELAALEKALRPVLMEAQRTDRHGAAYGEATARLLLEHVNELKARLRAVRGAHDRRALHRARIAGKRLRYLLEPLAAIEPTVAALLGELKEFQDRLGALGDAYVRTDELALAAGEAAALWAPAAVQSLVASGSDQVADPDALVGLFALTLEARTEIESGYEAVRQHYLEPTSWLDAAKRLAPRLRSAHAWRRDHPLESAKRGARTA